MLTSNNAITGEQNGTDANIPDLLAEANVPLNNGSDNVSIAARRLEKR
jgi:hypothetical protein